MRWVALRCVLCRFVSLRCVALFSVASFVRSCWGAFEAVCLSFLAWCGALGTLLVSLSNTTNFDLGSFYANFMEAFGAMPTTFQSTNQIKNTARFRKHLKKQRKLYLMLEPQSGDVGWYSVDFQTRADMPFVSVFSYIRIRVGPCTIAQKSSEKRFQIGPGNSIHQTKTAMRFWSIVRIH